MFKSAGIEDKSKISHVDFTQLKAPPAQKNGKDRCSSDESKYLPRWQESSDPWKQNNEYNSDIIRKFNVM